MIFSSRHLMHWQHFTVFSQVCLIISFRKRDYKKLGIKSYPFPIRKPYIKVISTPLIILLKNYFLSKYPLHNKQWFGVYLNLYLEKSCTSLSYCSNTAYRFCFAILSTSKLWISGHFSLSCLSFDIKAFKWIQYRTNVEDVEQKEVKSESLAPNLLVGTVSFILFFTLLFYLGVQMETEHLMNIYWHIPGCWVSYEVCDHHQFPFNLPDFTTNWIFGIFAESTRLLYNHTLSLTHTDTCAYTHTHIFLHP